MGTQRAFELRSAGTYASVTRKPLENIWVQLLTMPT